MLFKKFITTEHVPRITDICSCIYVLGCKLSLVRLCDTYFGIIPVDDITPLTPNDPYSGRTSPLTSKNCILYIYSTNICTEYFKRVIYSPLFSLQNTVCFIILKYLFPILLTFYIQVVLKLKKKIRRQKAKT